MCHEISWSELVDIVLTTETNEIVWTHVNVNPAIRNIDDNSNSLIPDQGPSNSASVMDPSCSTFTLDATLVSFVQPRDYRGKPKNKHPYVFF